MTALIAAANYGRTDIVQMLLQSGKVRIDQQTRVSCVLLAYIFSDTMYGDIRAMYFCIILLWVSNILAHSMVCMYLIGAYCCDVVGMYCAILGI